MVPASLAAAAAEYPDLSAFWTRSISRTCGPNTGVCHDNNQFPSFQTKESMVRAIGQQCNKMRFSAATIDNICEQPGDWFKLGDFRTHVGSVTPDNTGDPTRLTITLRDPLPASATGAASFVHSPAGEPTVELSIPPSALMSIAPGARSIVLAFAPLNDPKTTMGLSPGQPLSRFLLPYNYLPGSDASILLGDPNGDGVFGAELGGSVIRPGKPLLSYIFLRAAGPLPVGPGATLTNVAKAATFEAQMPIANAQHWDFDNALPALFCWIQGLEPGGVNADGPIDYARCDMSTFPKVAPLDGTATTFGAIYSKILQPSCAAPCHHAGTKQATKLFMDGVDHTYDTLLGVGSATPSEQPMGLPYVTPNAPDASYLYVKMTGGAAIAGSAMPPSGALGKAATDAVRAWIAQGANRY